ncbi:hypothetical protein C922_01312 [Plasmodium inui San Antonio 1]|uniref:Uncharacterized protein n=1 Tax=Plasmodium inui San Antonio 1 TaxID=1237626 RepID=W7A5A4_9APIC|nr:hypothetical protein C922_01312 [Plasmodium inui San Antonio 1]EUD68292.1 hypothetical protein C922_01312 [Plasmodium inui San Antonio 1]
MQYVKSKTVVIPGSTGKLNNRSVSIKNSSSSLKKELHTDVQGKGPNPDDPSDEERHISENAPRLKSSLKNKSRLLDGSTLEQVGPKRAGVEGGENEGDEGSVDDDRKSDDRNTDGGGNSDDRNTDGGGNSDDRNTDGGGNSDDRDTDGDGNSSDRNTDGRGNSGEEESVDKPKGPAKSAIKKVSVFQRLATTHTLSSSYRCVSPKLKKLHTENLQAALKGEKPKKAFSMRIDKNVTYSSFTPYNKAKKINSERKLNMMRAKTQILKIAERFMSTDKIKSFQMVERRKTQSFAKREKPLSDQVQILGPFSPKKGGDELTKSEKSERSERPHKSGDIPTSLRRSSTKHGDMSNDNRGKEPNETAAKWGGQIEAKQKKRPTLRKHRKMVLRKADRQQGFALFENMLGVSHSGRVYSWDGYQWRGINIFYECFVSLCSDKKGHIICINTDFKPGFLMSNRCFEKIDTHREAVFLKMAVSARNKMWAINLRGDLQKWDKYEWVQVKKAYGIAKLKSLAFDRNDHLWVLDEKNYFYIFNRERKNWMLHSDSSRGGGNIDDFDFNESNFLVALTFDGMIKICRDGRWVKCGMLGQMKISSLHFLRKAGEREVGPAVSAKNPKRGRGDHRVGTPK